ncbi:hypothetical protein D3C87_578050 [compost metagenome]
MVGRGQQVQLADRLGGFGQQVVEHGGELVCHRLDAGRFEQCACVLPLETDALVRLDCGEHQVELRLDVVAFSARDFDISQFHALRFSFLQTEHDLEQRMMRQAALRIEHLDEHFERVVLLAEGTAH